MEKWKAIEHRIPIGETGDYDLVYALECGDRSLFADSSYEWEFEELEVLADNLNIINTIEGNDTVELGKKIQRLKELLTFNYYGVAEEKDEAEICKIAQEVSEQKGWNNF